MNRLGLIWAVFVWVVAPFCGVFGQDRYAYIDRYRPIAIAEMQRTGIPASIKLAQGILESNAGASDLARRANNHFGIKCGGTWRGKSMHKADDDRNAHGKLVKSCFRHFDSAEESFIAHSEFIRDPSKEARYGFLFAFDVLDYRSWAYGLKKAGYATNPKYPQLLIRIIEQYNLDAIDQEALESLARSKSGMPTGPIVADAVGAIRSYPVEYVNRIPVVTAYEGDTPETLAERLDIKVEKLVRFNEIVIDEEDAFEQGDIVYLKSKKGRFKGSQEYHVVRPGETILQISQEYGIKLKKLMKRNDIPVGMEPAAGQKISLKGKNDLKVRLVVDKSRELRESELKEQPVPSDPAESFASNDGDQPAPFEQEVLDSMEANATYTIQRGDTLYRIARKHGLSVKDLKKINNLTGDVIHPGQVLKLSE